MSRPLFPQVDPETYLLPEPTMAAITEYVSARVPGASPTEIAAAVADYLAENPVSGDFVTADELSAAVASLGDQIADHLNDPTPHPVYDNFVDFTLIFENGLI